MLGLTQFLIFELGDRCNLADVHPKCPANSRIGKTGQLSDKMIIETAVEAYESGFDGMIGWHFYNEPMMQFDRMSGLMIKLRERVGDLAKFILWTNGTILPLEDKNLNLFNKIVISNYENKPAEYFEDLQRKLPSVEITVQTVSFDGRLKHYTEGLDRSRCLRPYIELIFNAYGDAVICCQDWRNEIGLGNLKTKSFERILARRNEVMATICGDMMSDDSPMACLKCNGKVKEVPCFVETVYDNFKETANGQTNN